MEPTKRSKLVLISSISVLAALLFLLWYLLFGPGSRISVEIFVAPSDAEVIMDGEPVSGNIISIAKGKHTFKATREHFGDVTKEIDTANLPKTSTIYLALFPNDPRGQTFLDTHPDEQLRYERISGAEFTTLQEKILRENPITTILPHQTIDYRIDYDITRDTKEVYFLVTFYPPNALTPGSKEYKDELQRFKAQALDFLEDNKVDTSKVNIKYSPNPDE